MHSRSLYWSGHVYTIGSELHLDMSRFQRPLTHLDMSAQHGPELRLHLSGQQEHVLTLYMFTPHGSEQHPGVSGKHEPVLVWTFLPHRGLNYSWMCLDTRSLWWSGHAYTIVTLAATGLVYTTEASTAPGHVFT
jgi:hypothetical protein